MITIWIQNSQVCTQHFDSAVSAARSSFQQEWKENNTLCYEQKLRKNNLENYMPCEKSRAGGGKWSLYTKRHYFSELGQLGRKKKAFLFKIVLLGLVSTNLLNIFWAKAEKLCCSDSVTVISRTNIILINILHGGI